MSLIFQTYESERWHQFLIYIAYNVLAFIINALMNNALPLFTKSACEWPIHGECRERC